MHPTWRHGHASRDLSHGILGGQGLKRLDAVPAVVLRAIDEVAARGADGVLAVLLEAALEPPAEALWVARAEGIALKIELAQSLGWKALAKLAQETSILLFQAGSG